MILRLMWHSFTMGGRWRAPHQGQGTATVGRVKGATARAVVDEDGEAVELPAADVPDWPAASARETSRLAINWTPLPPLDIPDYVFRWLGVELPAEPARPEPPTPRSRRAASPTTPLFLPR